MVDIKAGQAEWFLKKLPREIGAVLFYGSDAGLVSERAERLAKAFAGDPKSPGEVLRMTELDLSENPSRLGLELRWAFLAWADFYPAVSEGRVDGIWCGQGITPERQLLADFTSPYAVFDESLVVRADNPASAPDELAGQRIGAIEGSTNMTLAQTFPGVELVGFPGTEPVSNEAILEQPCDVLIPAAILIPGDWNLESRASAKVYFPSRFIGSATTNNATIHPAR